VAATEAVKRVLAEAEETFLADDTYTLGVWNARVGETLAVAARGLSAHVEQGDLLLNDDIALEQAELFADVCAEAIRAAAHSWGECSPAEAREEILCLLEEAYAFAPERPGWDDLMLALLRGTAALEPVTSGLREGDLPVTTFLSTGGKASSCFMEVARQAYWAVYVLCA
jgi:hypothetical protein